MKSQPAFVAAILIALASTLQYGCADHATAQPRATPNIAPTSQPSAQSLRLGSAAIPPMYRELLAINLDSVVRVAAAQNLDILQARQRVAASRGRYESSVEAIFPVIAPYVTVAHLEGRNQAVTGQLVAANFNTLQPALAIQWVLNPGHVIYDIIASKKRLLGTEQQERSVLLETIRNSEVEYYELALAQARLGVAREAVAEAEELLRITDLRLRAGSGLPADKLRGQASLAGRRQDLAIALNRFYEASIALALTLHLDSTVTLVPKSGQITPVALIRDDLDIDQMLNIAIDWRPDLQSVRQFASAAAADTGAVVWGGIGPQLQAGYQFSGLASHVTGQDFGLHEQQKASANAGWALGLSTFGQAKTAEAVEGQARVDVDRQIDVVRSQVVRSAQESGTNAKLIPMAKEQVDAAAETLRLAQENLRSGTMITLDVLQAEDTLNEARLRYANAVVHYNQSQVNLLAALGLIDRILVSPAGSSAATQSSAQVTKPMLPIVADDETR